MSKKKEDELLAKTIDIITEKFGAKAILRGGMVLKALGSIRYTNDVDYVFVPYKSKNEIVKDLVECLNKIPNSEISYSLNSKCLRIKIKVEDTMIQVEAKVAKKMNTEFITNKLISYEHNLPVRIIPIVNHSISMANKLAAWNERRLIRDVYDIWFFIQMGVSADQEILKKRLIKPIYSRTVKPEEYFKGVSINEFYEFIRGYVNSINDNQIEEQLGDYLLPKEIVGLSLMFKAAFVKLI